MLFRSLRRGDAAGLEPALRRINEERRREIQVIQSLQRREALRGELLQRAPELRWLLAANARWCGPLLARFWAISQRRLRQGVLALAPLS